MPGDTEGAKNTPECQEENKNMATLLGILGLLMQMRNSNSSNNSQKEPDYYGYPVSDWFTPEGGLRSDKDWGDYSHMFSYDYWS